MNGSVAGTFSFLLLFGILILILIPIPIRSRRGRCSPSRRPRSLARSLTAGRPRARSRIGGGTAARTYRLRKEGRDGRTPAHTYVRIFD